VEENEEKQTEQRDKRSAQKRRKIKIRRFILLLITAAVIAFIAFNWSWLSPVAILQRIQAAKSGVGVVTAYPADIAGKQIAGISGFGGGGILAVDSGCFLLRSDSTTYFQYAMASTTAAIGDRAALVYEKGGTKFQYFNTEGRVFERERRLKFWNTNPISLLRASASSSSVISETALPFRIYFPSVGVSRQPRMFIRVDFPDPEGPMMATYSFFSILRLMFWSACTVSSPTT
jgi:hypothetical protein